MLTRRRFFAKGNFKNTECVNLTYTKVIASAAGGTSHRLYPGCAMDFSRSRKDRRAILELLENHALPDAQKDKIGQDLSEDSEA
jgi:hypothetical protein